MKVVILAGGFGTRISEESIYKPKPMIEIGGMPILWHIMKIYSSYGFNEFIICAGYKQHVIKKWFEDYFLYTAESVTFDYKEEGKKSLILNHAAEPWKVTVVDTGLETQTGGRIKRIQRFIGNEPFMVTYGDAVGNIDIKSLIQFHEKGKRKATISMYSFAQEKGVVEVASEGRITSFREKSDMDGDLINIGFMVFEPDFFSYIDNDLTILEREPFTRLVEEGQMDGYTHNGFWQCMDTIREKQRLEKLWGSGDAPWKTWRD